MTEDDLATGRRILLAWYPDDRRAAATLEMLAEGDFPMDRVSLLARGDSSGDDPLGVYYPNLGERMQGWGRMGALWGGIWGLLSGAAGLFVIPGLGPMLIAGPLVETLVGAAVGAGIGGGAMAGAAALSQLAAAVHRMGVPDDALEEVERLLDQGHHLVLLIVANEEAGRWQDRLTRTAPERLMNFPYVGLTEAMRGAD